MKPSYILEFLPQILSAIAILWGPASIENGAEFAAYAGVVPRELA
jgi:hypothetical protein